MDEFKWYDKKIEFAESQFFWKYLDIHKFLNLILNKQISFSRFDLFEDPLEGISVENLDVLHTIKDSPKGSGTDQEGNGRMEKYARYWERASKTQRKKYASCWFLSEKESWAMWNLYSNPDSIVLRADPTGLIQQMTAGLHHVKRLVADNLRSALMGQVEYLPLWPFDRSVLDRVKNADIHNFKKDISFQHEHEFRFILEFQKEVKAEIITLEIDPKDIRIYTHPNMVGWKVDNLKRLIQNLNIDVEIEHSKLCI